MAFYLSRYHTLTSSLSLKSLDNAKLSSSLFPSPINLSSNNTCVHLLNNNHKTTPLLSSTPRFLIVIAMAPPPKGGKAKKVVGLIKLALEAGKATYAPLVGLALGSKGVNIMAFCKDYNSRTTDKDKSFTFVLKTPHTSILLLKAAGMVPLWFVSYGGSISYSRHHVLDIWFTVTDGSSQLHFLKLE